MGKGDMLLLGLLLYDFRLLIEGMGVFFICWVFCTLYTRGFMAI